MLRVLPLEICSRLWDCFLLEGIVFLFRTSLAIIQILSPKLLGKDFDECVQILQKRPAHAHLWDECITEAELFKYIENFKLPQSSITKVEEIVEDVFFFDRERKDSKERSQSNSWTDRPNTGHRRSQTHKLAPAAPLLQSSFQQRSSESKIHDSVHTSVDSGEMDDDEHPVTQSMSNVLSSLLGGF